jgi:hypothetical protein
MKPWLPFGITFTAGLAAAAGLYFWKGHRMAALQDAARPSAVGRASTDSEAARKPAGVKKPVGPEQAKLDAAMRPTRNGIRSLFERSAKILDMDEEQVSKLLAELEATGRIRSPLAGISLMAAYARLAELNPAAAMDRATKLERGELRGIAMFATMNEWLVKDRKGAVAWFASSGDEEEKKQYLTMAAFSMGGSDPDLITELTGAINDPEAKKKALLDSLGALAFSDPDAAIKKLDEIEDPDERSEAEERVYQGFLMRYPEKALDFAMAKPPGDKAREAARQSLVQWGEQDPGAALKWLTSQNKDVQKELFDMPGSGPGWGFGKATPEQIGDAARQLGDQTQKDKLYAAYANAQGMSNPTTGLSQLSNIKDAELQKSTAASLGMAAARSGKVNDMTTWLETVPPNDARDSAVAAFAAGIAQKDPTAAGEWAAKITSQTIRQQTIEALKNPAAMPIPEPPPLPGRPRRNR